MASQERGFTLMELLVVIAIIGILVGIAIPSFNAARALAQRIGCKGTLKSVGSGLAIYLESNRNRYPRVANLASELGSTFPTLPQALKGYIGSDKLRCPADNDPRYDADACSYEYNSWLCGRELDDNWVGEMMGPIYTQVVWDYEPFHGPAGTDLCINYLYADGTVKGLGENE